MSPKRPRLKVNPHLGSNQSQSSRPQATTANIHRGLHNIGAVSGGMRPIPPISSRSTDGNRIVLYALIGGMLAGVIVLFLFFGAGSNLPSFPSGGSSSGPSFNAGNESQVVEDYMNSSGWGTQHIANYGYVNIDDGELKSQSKTTAQVCYSMEIWVNGGDTVNGGYNVHQQRLVTFTYQGGWQISSIQDPASDCW